MGPIKINEIIIQQLISNVSHFYMRGDFLRIHNNNKEECAYVYNGYTNAHNFSIYFMFFNVHCSPISDYTHHFYYYIPTSEHPNPLFYAPFRERKKNSHG